MGPYRCSAVYGAPRTEPMRRPGLHRGHPDDDVAWVTAGTAILAGVFALTLR